MKKNTKNIVRLTKGEKLLYTLGVFCIVATIVLKVFSSASISNLKMSIEEVSYKIENQEKKNQSLVMQVNELTSYENLSNVLKEMGLAYNNENIIVIK
jgi:cell division protein FtsL